MPDNKDLNKAAIAKKDEFFTQLSDIEKELKHYRKYFKDKVIFLNCDDPEYSNFWKYFQLNFYEFDLKKLIATHYEEEAPSYKMEIVRKDNVEGQLTLPDYVKTPLEQNGDFRSPECIEILKEADIVITNPPFSLFREYVAQLIEYKKKFIIIGNINAVKYREVFPHLMNNEIWLGISIHSGDREFEIPKDYPITAAGSRIDKDGRRFIRVKGVRWFTNLDIKIRHDEYPLYKTYNPNEYFTYYNYDAININKTSDIPIDYDGYMGVPITIMDVYNPDQFEIIGLGTGELGKQIGVKKNHRGRTDLAYVENGKYKCPFERIIIRNKKVVKR